jgi:Flp pilus assembly protein TadG
MVWFRKMINYIIKHINLLRLIFGAKYKTAIKKSFLKCTTGVTAVEFAIIAPIFLVFVYAILNFGIYYYYTSIVENSLFHLSRAIMNEDVTKRPTDLLSARAIFNSNMGSFNIANIGDREVVLSINTLTLTGPSLTAKPKSEYNVTTGRPLILRVVYPRPELIKVDSLVAAWPQIFGDEVDTSIMIESKLK